MKQRMYNTFLRKLNNKVIANLFTEIGYTILKIYYYITSIFIKIRKKCIPISYNNVLNARKIISGVRPKPDMTYKANNQPIDPSVQLSVIIPAYNVEEYINECLSTVLNQKTKYSYEVIVINDGSTDDTESKIKEFNDKRITYINQKNGGLSEARNVGLDTAKGKYVLFLDSDDVMCKGAIEIMMDSICENDADIVVGSFYMFSKEFDTKQDCIIQNQIIVGDASQTVKKPGYAWGKVYKRSLFEKVRFPVGAWYEDTLISSVIYRMCKKMVTLDKIVCGYRINPKGISQTARLTPKSLDHYWVMEDVMDKVEENNLKNDEVFYDIVFNHMSTFLYRRLSLMDEEVIKSAFILACDMLNKIRLPEYMVHGSKMKRDLEEAFKTGNYDLWKLAAFLI